MSSLRGLSLRQAHKEQVQVSLHTTSIRNVVAWIDKTIKYDAGEIQTHDDYSKDKTPEETQHIANEVSRLVMVFYRREAA